MLPYVIERELATADGDGICASQTPLAAGNMLINGLLATAGVAYLLAQRQVVITPVGDETGTVFTLEGTDEQGRFITEDIAGDSTNAVTSVLDYFTVTRVAIDAAAAGAITVGTNGVGASIPLPLDYLSPNSRTMITLEFLSGTANVTVEFTNDNPYGDLREIQKGINVATPGPFQWFNHPSASLVGAASATYAAVDAVMRAVRLLTNSGTGAVRMTVTQQSLL